MLVLIKITCSNKHTTLNQCCENSRSVKFLSVGRGPHIACGYGAGLNCSEELKGLHNIFCGLHRVGCKTCWEISPYKRYCTPWTQSRWKHLQNRFVWCVKPAVGNLRSLDWIWPSSVAFKREPPGSLREELLIPGRKFVPGRNWGGKAVD